MYTYTLLQLCMFNAYHVLLMFALLLNLNVCCSYLLYVTHICCTLLMFSYALLTACYMLFVFTTHVALCLSCVALVCCMLFTVCCVFMFAILLLIMCYLVRSK